MSAADRTLIRAIRGPITLITVGVLFALNNFTPYDFSKTWPVLLIVFGTLSLLRRGTAPLPVPPQQPPIPTYPRYDYPPPPGGYAQTAYPTPEPPRPGEPRPGEPR